MAGAARLRRWRWLCWEYPLTKAEARERVILIGEKENTLLERHALTLEAELRRALRRAPPAAMPAAMPQTAQPLARRGGGLGLGEAILRPGAGEERSRARPLASAAAGASRREVDALRAAGSRAASRAAALAVSSAEADAEAASLRNLVEDLRLENQMLREQAFGFRDRLFAVRQQQLCPTVSRELRKPLSEFDVQPRPQLSSMLPRPAHPFPTQQNLATNGIPRPRRRWQTKVEPPSCTREMEAAICAPQGRELEMGSSARNGYPMPRTIATSSREADLMPRTSAASTCVSVPSTAPSSFRSAAASALGGGDEELMRKLEEKESTIASLRLQAQLLSVREGLHKSLRGTEDVEVRCQALKASVSKFMTG